MADRAQGAVAVFFSKDRAFQLDAALSSFRDRCGDLSAIDVHVLYAASSPLHAMLYRTLAEEHPEATLHEETDFRADLLTIVRGSSHIFFVVDDSLFFADFTIRDGTRALASDPRVLAFSYRLGRNTTYCYALDRQQRIPEFRAGGARTLTYEWTTGEYDFAYPIEISSSIYRTEDLLPMLETLAYRNPNRLESVIAGQAGSFRETHPLVVCYPQSVALSAPVNLVQRTYKNRAGGTTDLSADALAERYARGQRLDLRAYDGLVPLGCHQEIDFVYRREQSIPAVSVVVPCWNQAAFLEGSVASVVGQSFRDWELVIVDDGSPDDTGAEAERLIAAHPGKHIRLVRQENRGLAGARNAGMAAARGRYVLPLDADDALAPTFLERTVALLEAEPAVAIAYTDQEWFGERSEIVRNPDFRGFLEPATNLLNYCALYRREVWDAVGGYDTTLVHGYEDWDFWIGAVERGYRARRIPEPLFRYRIRGGSMIEAANRHDTELRRRIRAKHPRLYRPWLRLPRFVAHAALALRRRAAGTATR